MQPEAGLDCFCARQVAAQRVDPLLLRSELRGKLNRAPPEHGALHPLVVLAVNPYNFYYQSIQYLSFDHGDVSISRLTAMTRLAVRTESGPARWVRLPLCRRAPALASCTPQHPIKACLTGLGDERERERASLYPWNAYAKKEILDSFCHLDRNKPRIIQ